MNIQGAKNIIFPPLVGSSLQNKVGQLNINRSKKGNQNISSGIEQDGLRKVTSRENSIEDDSLVTETEVSFGKDINSRTSVESGNKGAQSFFAGISKKRFKEISKSNRSDEQTPINVIINGHSITDRLLKKAEKMAGSFHPGKYWYDNRAGFWGVMGGPCIGIIPPFIEEFNYPMPENCAGVNGRELHEKT